MEVRRKRLANDTRHAATAGEINLRGEAGDPKGVVAEQTCEASRCL